MEEAHAAIQDMLYEAQRGLDKAVEEADAKLLKMAGAPENLLEDVGDIEKYLSELGRLGYHFDGAVGTGQREPASLDTGYFQGDPQCRGGHTSPPAYTHAEDDGMLSPRTFRIRRNEDAILGVGLVRAFGSGKSTPRWVSHWLKGQPMAPHVYYAPRASQTRLPRNPTRPLGAFHTTRSPGFKSTARRCLLAKRARASEDLFQ